MDLVVISGWSRFTVSDHPGWNFEPELLAYSGLRLLVFKTATTSPRSNESYIVVRCEEADTVISPLQNNDLTLRSDWWHLRSLGPHWLATN